MKALFLDFEDSFSYNLVQELTEAGLEVEVLHWSEFSQDHRSDLLVLGPGPGHPDDYQKIYPLIQSWLAQDEKSLLSALVIRFSGDSWAMKSEGPRTPSTDRRFS